MVYTSQLSNHQTPMHAYAHEMKIEKRKTGREQMRKILFGDSQAFTGSGFYQRGIHTMTYVIV